MKKVLFVLPYYKIGGTLTSFSNLIPLIDKTKYEVEAFAITNEVDDISILPKGINYIGLNLRRFQKKGQKRNIKTYIIKFLKLGKRLLATLGYDPSSAVFKKMAQPLSGKYDIVIAFQEGQPTKMAQFISAPYKIAWIHSMYSRFKAISKCSATDVYNYYDNIVCVSQTAAADMINSEPQWKRKIHVVYNAINFDAVVEKAERKIVLYKKINLVSVGRIDPVKRFSLIPQIASEIKKVGISFDWWIIGGIAIRKEYNKLTDSIKQYDVSDCVHIVGALSNPYPYIKYSDLLVCLSSSETFNYTIAEAKAIGTPIVSTDFASAFEFLEKEKTGLILPIEDVASGIIRILNDKKLYDSVKQNLSNKSVEITKEQLETLLENE